MTWAVSSGLMVVAVITAFWPDRRGCQAGEPDPRRPAAGGAITGLTDAREGHDYGNESLAIASPSVPLDPEV